MPQHVSWLQVTVSLPRQCAAMPVEEGQQCNDGTLLGMDWETRMGSQAVQVRRLLAMATESPVQYTTPHKT